jgi:hypothetical protein
MSKSQLITRSLQHPHLLWKTLDEWSFFMQGNLVDPWSSLFNFFVQIHTTFKLMMLFPLFWRILFLTICEHFDSFLAIKKIMEFCLYYFCWVIFQLFFGFPCSKNAEILLFSNNRVFVFCVVAKFCKSLVIVYKFGVSTLGNFHIDTLFPSR